MAEFFIVLALSRVIATQRTTLRFTDPMTIRVIFVQLGTDLETASFPETRRSSGSHGPAGIALSDRVGDRRIDGALP